MEADAVRMALRRQVQVWSEARGNMEREVEGLLEVAEGVDRGFAVCLREQLLRQEVAEREVRLLLEMVGISFD
jgi:hypothetical protein